MSIAYDRQYEGPDDQVVEKVMLEEALELRQEHREQRAEA